MSSQVNAENPWPGLEAFDEGSASFFKGRDKEAADCSRVIKRERLSVLLGKSGVGKSSLLRAGIFPLLVLDGFAPIYIRLSYEEHELELARQVEIAVRVHIAEHKGMLEASEPSEKESLWEYFHRRNQEWWSFRNEIIIPVLVFDQFEEIMTLGTESAARRRRSNKFLNELEELVENRVPEKLQRDLAANYELAETFSEQFDLGRADLRVVLTLREDFLAEFEELRNRFKSISVNRFRLLFLERARAMEAICKPNPRLVDEIVAEKIINRITTALTNKGNAWVQEERARSVDVDPALLSVFCHELNRRRIQKEAPKIDEVLVDEAREEILTSFYERAFVGMEESYRSFVEDKLLTVSGARDRFNYENALALPGIEDHGLQLLINRRLLRLETSATSTWIELSHDAIASVAQLSRKSRDERNRLLAEQREAEERAKAAEASAAAARAEKIRVARELKTRSRQRRQAVNSAIALLLLLVAYFAVIFSGRWALVEEIKRLKGVSALLNQEIRQKQAERDSLDGVLEKRESPIWNAPTSEPTPPTPTVVPPATATPPPILKPMSAPTTKPGTKTTPHGIFYDGKNSNDA
jgi:hypothetical protein